MYCSSLFFFTEGLIVVPFGAGLCARMPPAGIQATEMDEETLLELEIQQELDRINLDNDHFIGNDDADVDNNDALDVDGGVDGEAPVSLEGEVRLGRGGGGGGGGMEGRGLCPLCCRTEPTTFINLSNWHLLVHWLDLCYAKTRH